MDTVNSISLKSPRRIYSHTTPQWLADELPYIASDNTEWPYESLAEQHERELLREYIEKNVFVQEDVLDILPVINTNDDVRITIYRVENKNQYKKVMEFISSLKSIDIARIEEFDNQYPADICVVTYYNHMFCAFKDQLIDMIQASIDKLSDI